MKSKFLIPLLAGLALLCACKGTGNKDESSDSVSVTHKNNDEKGLPKDTAATSQKLIKKADIRFKVKSVQQTSEQIAALTASLNGSVIYHTIHSTTTDSSEIKRSSDSVMKVTVVNTTADMTVKIPPANLEGFMLQVTKMGIYINNSHMAVTDKSLDYLSAQLKLKNQKELVEKQKDGHNSPKTPDEMLSFKNNMVDEQISNRRTDDSVKNSVVTLNFYESNVINREIVANNDLTAYDPPVMSRLGMSISEGWNIFMLLVVQIVKAWVVLPIGLSVWMLVRYFKKKKAATLIKN